MWPARNRRTGLRRGALDATSLGPIRTPGGPGRRPSFVGPGLQGDRPSDFGGAALATAQGDLLLAASRSGLRKPDAGSLAGVPGSGAAQSVRSAGNIPPERDHDFGG